MPQTSTQNHPGRLLQVDGLRGMAVLLVFFFHAFFVRDSAALSREPAVYSPALRFVFWVAAFGWTGVDLFFVLSGFLITQVLLRAKGAGNYFRTFYLRRALRILPLYYGFLIFTLYAEFRLHATHLDREIWFWLNISNLRTAFNPSLMPALSHFWTLAIEEQFYFVWPAVVYYAKNRSLVVICSAGVVCSIVLRNLPFAQSMQHVYPDFIYRFTIFRLDGLLLGSLLAVLLQNRQVSERLGRFAGVGVVAGAGAVIATICATKSVLPSQWTRLGFTAIALLYVMLLLFCLKNEFVGRIFRSPVLREFGKYSYCIYVIHIFVLARLIGALTSRFAVFRDLHLEAPRLYLACYLTVAFGGLAVAYGLAKLSWMLLEGPILSLNSRFQYARPVKQNATTASGPRTLQPGVSAHVGGPSGRPTVVQIPASAARAGTRQ